MERFPRAKKVITTLRGSISASHNTWSGVLYDGQTLYEAPTYQITHIVDRVGGGDSFMAGLIYGLLNYPEDDQKALNYAVAASCFKAYHLWRCQSGNGRRSRKTIKRRRKWKSK